MGNHTENKNGSKSVKKTCLIPSQRLLKIFHELWATRFCSL